MIRSIYDAFYISICTETIISDDECVRFTIESGKNEDENETETFVCAAHWDMLMCQFDLSFDIKIQTQIHRRKITKKNFCDSITHRRPFHSNGNKGKKDNYYEASFAYVCEHVLIVQPTY